jgi:hypothetical protein
LGVTAEAQAAAAPTDINGNFEKKPLAGSPPTNDARSGFDGRTSFAQ